MQDFVVDFYKTTNVIDIVYLIITIITLIGGYRKGFVLSILSMAKWFVAYIFTLIMFPKAKPYLKGIIDNEYVLDIVLGVTIFVIVLFLILMINRGIRKAVQFTGLGSIDAMFGFFFGFSILVLSKFIPTIYFGIFTGLAMLLAMVSVLRLLASLILLIKPFNK